MADNNKSPLSSGLLTDEEQSWVAGGKEGAKWVTEHPTPPNATTILTDPAGAIPGNNGVAHYAGKGLGWVDTGHNLWVIGGSFLDENYRNAFIETGGMVGQNFAAVVCGTAGGILGGFSGPSSPRPSKGSASK